MSTWEVKYYSGVLGQDHKQCFVMSQQKQINNLLKNKDSKTFKYAVWYPHS
jgi:hypothetical protein